MADGISITDLEQKTEVTDNDNFAVDNGAITNKVTAKQIKDYMGPTYVKKAGDTMTGDLIIKKSQPILRGASNIDLSNVDGMCLAIEGKNANNKEFARIDLYRRGSVQQSEAHLIALNINGQKAELAVFINDEGEITSYAPTPLLTSNNTEIATTAFVKGLIKDYVTESWKDDNGNWYEVYASGKIRQGGYTTSTKTNLLKPMADGNYSVFTNTTDRSAGGIRVAVTNRTPTYFDVYIGAGDQAQGGGFIGFWLVEGQGA